MKEPMFFIDLRVGDCIFHVNPYKYQSTKQSEAKLQMLIIKELDFDTKTIFYLEDGKKEHELVQWNDLDVYEADDIRITTLCRIEALKGLKIIRSGRFSENVKMKEQ